MIKILFVCHGNICRSPMAEFVMKDLLRQRGLEGEVFVASAATSTEEIGNPVYPQARRKLEQEGIRVEKRCATQTKKSDYDQYDYIIGMEDRNIANILRITGGDPEGKVSRLLDFTSDPRNIADPWYSGDFNTTYRQIVEGCLALLEKMTHEEKYRR